MKCVQARIRPLRQNMTFESTFFASGHTQKLNVIDNELITFNTAKKGRVNTMIVTIHAYNMGMIWGLLLYDLLWVLYDKCIAWT